MTNLVNLYAPFVQPDDLVFDVGAFVGTLTEVFLELGARVVAVEPNPRMYLALRRQYRHNKHVTVLDCAIGAAAGQMLLTWHEGQENIGTLYPELWHVWPCRFAAVQPDRVATVSVCTLDDLIAQFGPPAYIKLDVEGGELPALQGLTRPVPALGFEFCPETKQQRPCCERLQELGFRYFASTLAEGPDLLVPWGTADAVLANIDATDWNHFYGNILACKERP